VLFYRMDVKKVRTAVIGVGHLGQHHARWYRSIRESELVGVYDIDQAKCRAVASEWGVTPFASLADLIGEVEAVSVAVPTKDHYEVAGELIEHRIDCLIEKPIAATVAEAENLVEMARRAGVILSVGHIERFNPAVRALGNYEISPRFIEAHRLAAFDPRGTDVAVVLDLMIHDIDLTLHLIKADVTGIDAAAVAIVSDRADIANARLTFGNGAVANLTASRISLRPMRKLRIFQRSGYYSLDLKEKQAEIYRLAGEDDSGEDGMRIPLGKSGREIIYNKAGAKDEDMLCNELTDFLKAVAARSQPEVTATEATAALRVAVEIVRLGLEGGGA
jgi:predicted dehydrogenase